ncbi:hypothetical protein GCM10029964_051320 [Kibdelosporangium lantanae]
MAGHVPVPDPDGPRGRREYAGDSFEQGGLPGTVGAYQGGDPTWLQREPDIPDHRPGASRDRYPVDP